MKSFSTRLYYCCFILAAVVVVRETHSIEKSFMRIESYRLDMNLFISCVKKMYLLIEGRKEVEKINELLL